MNDIRLALRSIARTPVFTAIVVLTLGVGVAGATAIASVARAMIFKPLPYPDPHELFVIGRGPDAVNTSVTMQTFLLLRDRFTGCEYMGASTGRPGVNMSAGDKAEYLRNALVTSGYFEAYGLVPRYGRTFRVEDEQPGRPRIAIVNERLAERTFGSAREAMGKTLTLGSQPHEVVGVLPAVDRTPPPPDIWLPLRSYGQGLNYTITCRLRDGRTQDAAAAELKSLQSEYAALHAGPMSETAREGLGLTPLQELNTRGHRPLLGMLGVAVAIVLLIACANSAWLFSARAVDRRAESAVRAALGASRWRIVHQILLESVVLALLGGALGILLVMWTLPWLLELPQAQGWQADMDLFVIAVAAFVATSAGALCGLVPAFRHARLDPIEALQSGSRRIASGRDATVTRRAMVFAEVALCMVLLVSSGLLVRCLANLHNVKIGFDPKNVVTAQVSMDDARYRTNAAVNALYDRVIDQLQKAPGVESAAVITNIPIDRGLNLAMRPPVPISGLSAVTVDWRYVTDSYFRTMRVALREGRDFAVSDRLGSVPVAIVNESFVKRYFPEGRAIGFRVETIMGNPDARQIVGVVADTQQAGLKIAPPPTIYVPVRQVSDDLFSGVHSVYPVSWVVRSRGASMGTADVLAAALRAGDPRLPIARVRTMDEVIDGAMGETRLQATVLSAFGVVSVLMAVTALAGTILYAVMRRKRDIGVRLALGADVPGMLRSIVTENLLLVSGGIVAGVAGAVFIRELLRPFLFGVTPTDPITYVSAGVLLFFVAAVASVVAAVPVMRIDPANTLRSE